MVTFLFLFHLTARILLNNQPDYHLYLPFVIFYVFFIQMSHGITIGRA